MTYMCQKCREECNIHMTSETNFDEAWGHVRYVTTNYEVSDCCNEEYWEDE